jgi:hypothetical protein
MLEEWGRYFDRDDHAFGVGDYEIPCDHVKQLLYL